MEYEEDVYVDILDEGPVDKEDYCDFKGKGIVESGEFDRWDGGSVSGADESDHFYSRYRNEGRDYGESRSYKVRSVVENDAEVFDKRKRHEAEDKGGSLSDRYWREAESDEGEEEGQFSRRHIKHGSGDKERKRNYRRRTVVDGDSSDEEDEERFTRKLNMHGFEDKKRERKYRRRRVVDDDYSDEEAEEEELQMGKLNMHVSEDKEHSRNYSHRRVVIDDHSDDKVEEQFTKKLIIRGYGDKDHKRIYRRRRVVDDDYSDDEAEEPQITRKVIKDGPGDKQHSRNSKRRKVIGDDYSDNDFEFVAKHSKERDDSGGQDKHSRRILSRRHSRSKDGKMSEGHIEKDRDRSRHRDDSHERKRDHRHDKHLKHDMYNNVKERGGDVEVDKYKRRQKDIRHSTRYTSENDDEDDWEREILEKERDYDYMKERGRNVKEEKYDRRRDMHHSARYQSEHDDDDYEWEMAIMERKTDYVYIKERGNGAEEDKYNRRPRGMRHSTRYQTDHDDDDWEREMMERERCSWERGREMNDNSYEMKHSKREKDGDFRGRDNESLMRTSLIERGKERDLRGQTGDIWEESQVINQHVKGKMGRSEWNYVRRDLREQITEAKEKSHRIELTDGEKERDSTEQQSQSLDMSLKRELEERQKDRDFRGRDKECIGKSKEIQRNKESKWGSRKMNLSESTISKMEIEPRGTIREKEKIHKVIRKKYLIERDITSMEDSHKSKWDREMGEIISKRDFCQKDSGKQDMEDQMHFVKETDSEDYNIRSREMSQEIGWGRKTRQRYQKREFMSRDQREREGRHIILERDSVCQLNEKLLKKQDKEKREELWDRGFNNDDRETTSRDFVERDTWKPNLEIREKSLEKEVMHKENERESKYGDVHREKSHLKELLNKAEENRRGKGDKMNHKKTLENDSDDNGNQRDLMIWDADMEKSRQKELLNKEEGKSRRDSVKINHDNALENDSLDKENDRNSAVRSSVCREKCTKTIEGETIRELQEEKEKCREQRKETKADEAEADAGTESERQQKTIFAYQISTKANDRDVYEFFLKAGKVRDVRLVMDPIGRHFIGVGYIEFYHSMSIPAAVLLSGKLLHGQPVMIKPPETDDMHSTKNAGGSDISGPCPGGCNKLCVENLHDSVTEALLHQVFEAFGTIELVQFDSAEARHCERKCIIQFARLEDAQAARSLSGHLALAGQLIKVSPINDHDEVQVVSVDTNDCNEAEGNDLVSDIGVQNEVQVACADTNRCNEAEGSDLVSDIGVQNEMQGRDAKTIASSEEKGSGMVPVGQLESALQKLEPSGNELNKSSSPADVDSLTLPSESLKHLVPPPSIQAFVTSLKAVLQVPGAAIPIVDTVGVPSECLHLMNMFDSNMQASEEFELRVKEDIEELCYKFGKPKEIHIDKNGAGSVYLRFKDTEAAIVAQRTLHGRWFAGKMITATYMDRQIYDAKFPCIEQTSAQGQPPLAWLPHNYGPRFPINGQTLAQGPTSAMWLPQTFGSNFPTGQQPLAPGATSAMWMPNNNPVAFGAGFGNGGQFMQPLVPQGNTFPEMRPNIW